MVTNGPTICTRDEGPEPGTGESTMSHGAGLKQEEIERQVENLEVLPQSGIRIRYISGAAQGRIHCRA